MNAIVARARELAGVKFRHQGRNATCGLDCIGLVVEAYRGAGFSAQDYTAYSRHPRPEELLGQLEKNLVRVECGPEEIRAGDVLVFWIFNGVPQHMGLATGAGTMIHTDQHVGKVVESRLGRAWLKRLHSVWRREDE